MSTVLDLKHALARDRVSSLPIREAIQVTPATIVRAAAALMRTKRLGCAIMVDQSRPVGVFTERSVLEVLTHDASLDNLPVKDFVDTSVRAVRTSDPIRTVWDAIQREGVRFVCVTDDDENLVGLTGQRGLAEYVADFFPQQVMVQRLGSKPWMGTREGA